MAVKQKDVAVAGLTVAVAAVAGAQTSSADPAQMEEYAPMWDGIYIGAAVGIMDGDAPFYSSDNDYEFDGDVVFGGFIGFNHQFDNNIVAGAEAAIQSAPDVDSGGAGAYGDYEVDYIVDAKFRLGFAMDHFLPYVFAGVSGGESGIGNFYENEYGFFGANYGIGIDFKLGEHFSIGAEVLGRTIFDPYHEDSENHNPSHWQGMLRAAFHL